MSLVSTGVKYVKDHALLINGHCYMRGFVSMSKIGQEDKLSTQGDKCK